MANSPRSRKGTAADRGKIVRFPPEMGGSHNRGGSRLLPGIIAGAADLDPAAVLTATVAGATFGLSVAWVVLLCIPILIQVFGVSARIGYQTRLGLIRLVRDHFGKSTAIFLACMVCVVNVLMIVADLMAVSDALAIVLRQSRLFFPAVVAFAVWYILTLAGYDRVSRTLSVLALFLLGYVAAAVMSVDSLPQLARGVFVPEFHPGTAYALAVIAVFGSLLTPDVIVWQTSTKREMTSAFHAAEGRFGCVVAALVSLSAIIAASSMRVEDPGSMTTQQAAQALSPLGEMGPILFSLGIIGSGLVALPILVASLCFSISEAAGWTYGLNEAPWNAKSFYTLLCGVLVVAVVVNLGGINTVRTLYWSQILAGLFIVPILYFILRIANDRRIMTSVNTRWENFWLGGAVGGLVAANLIFLFAEILQ